MIKQLLMNSGYWVLNKKVVKELGIETAFLLSNFAEADTMMKDNNGWFYQTTETVEKMTGLNRYKQDKSIDELMELGILLKEVRGMPAKRYFKIDYQKVSDIVFNKLQFANGQQTSLSKINKQVCKPSTTNKERINKQNNINNNNDIADGNKYKDIFEYYLTFNNLISHQKYRSSYRKAMKRAERDLSLSAEEMKMIIKRHSQVVEITKNHKNSVKVRTISELFGQKKYQSTNLICEDYLDTGSYYKKFLKNNKKISNANANSNPGVKEVI